jgi:hypothetical protein
MKKILTNYSLAVSIGTYLVLYLICWPFYQFVFDVDGVGYSVVTEHIINGNWDRAVNGFWSPLHSWLVVPFVKAGIGVRDAFFITNAFISSFVLVLLSELGKKMNIEQQQKLPFLMTSVVILLHFTYFELAADILVLLFLLLYMLLVLHNRFFDSWKMQVYCGITVGFAYLAKTYALPFLMLIHFSLFTHHFICRKKMQWGNLFIFMITTLSVCAPWITVISNKYNGFTFGNSSVLNQGWVLGEPVNKTAFFRYPHYKDSPGWWEDPFYMQDHFVNMFTSLNYFIKQLRLFLYNIPLFLKVLVDISAFSITVIVAILFNAFYKKDEVFLRITFVLIIYPLGYLLTFVEGRYLWLLNLLIFLCGTVLLQQSFKLLNLRHGVKTMLAALFYLSFLLEPLNNLKDTIVYESGKENFQVAAYIKSKTNALNFTSNTNSSEGQVIAFLAKRRFFHINQPNFSFGQLKSEMQKSGVTLLLFYYEREHEKTAILKEFTSANGFLVSEIKKGILLFESVDLTNE